MLLKIFNLLDLFSAIIILLIKLDIQYSFFWVFPIYLIIKGAIYIPDPSSIIDVIAGIVIVLAMLGFSSIITWIAMLWLLQKVLFSFKF